MQNVTLNVLQLIYTQRRCKFALLADCAWCSTENCFLFLLFFYTAALNQQEEVLGLRFQDQDRHHN